MIDLIVPAHKNIYRFYTMNGDVVQSAVEYWCINVMNLTYDDCIFSLPIDTGNKKKYQKYSVTMVKSIVTKKSYKFELGSYIQSQF